MEEVSFFDRTTLPAQTIDNGHVIRSSEGNLQLIMDAPRIEKYSQPEVKTVYPKGVSITFYDENNKAKAFFTSQYAISYDEKNIIETHDSVVVIDYRSHDTIYLSQLIWNSELHKIYSDSAVHSVNGSKVTYGDSFESDENFECPIIVHQRGTMEWSEKIE